MILPLGPITKGETEASLMYRSIASNICIAPSLVTSLTSNIAIEIEPLHGRAVGIFRKFICLGCMMTIMSNSDKLVHLL